MSAAYRQQVANVINAGWTTYICIEEDKQGREVRMPQWVMDHACRHVDASTAVAVRVDPDGYRVVNAYLSEDEGLEPFGTIEEAIEVADDLNEERGIGPLVLPSNFVIIGGAA